MERSSKKREVKRETRTNAQEEPAKVYRPRTMTPKPVNPDTESETTKPHVADNAEEPTKKRSYSAKEKSSEKSSKSKSDEKSGESSYKPRTLKIKNTEEVSFRNRFAPDDRDNSSESEERSERPSKKRSEERDERPKKEGFSAKPSRFDDKDQPTNIGGYNARPYRTEDRGERPSKSRFSDKPSRSDRGEERTSTKSRFGSRSNEETKERGDRFGSRPSRFEKSGDRKERNDRFDSKSRRNEDSDNASGYKSRTFKKKYDDEFTSTSKPRRESAKVEKTEREDDGLIRLNKYVANSGLCSRREADELIQNGMISVNGVVITQLGSRVNPEDEICYKGKTLDAERKVYILLNKPKDYVTTVEDPHAKRTVMELIDGACEERVYPVGRLDRNSTGVLLLTNDGEMTKKLTHPSFMKKKIYHVELDKKVSVEDMEKIIQGVEVDGEILKVDSIDYTEDSNGTEVGVEIHTGQNRVVRRIFESLFYRVVRLDRVYFAGLTKKNLPRGKWRFLTQKEVNMLKMNRF
jgi:23S rRNA pseudouridine2605 synthase